MFHLVIFVQGFICLPWLYSLFLTVLPVLFAKQTRYRLNGFLLSCSLDFSVFDSNSGCLFLILFVCVFILPLFLVTLFYFLALKALIEKGNELKSITANITKVSLSKLSVSHSSLSLSFNKISSMIKRERQLKKTILTNVFLFCFTWMPYTMVMLVFQYFSEFESFLTPTNCFLAMLSLVVSSILNPIAYVLTKKFKEKSVKIKEFTKDKAIDKDKRREMFSNRQMYEFTSKTPIKY